MMTVPQVKIFNALIVMLSICLGANLTSSLRDYALMVRWRFLASKQRSLREFDLLLQCASLRKLFQLMRHSRRPDSYLPSRTQCLCAVWILVNIALQVLVALLGLTYNLTTSSIPERRFGEVEVVDLHVVRDVWGAKDPTVSAQLGYANSYGVQGQDFLFPDFGSPIPGQGNSPSWGLPSSPTIYALDNLYTGYKYVFHDQNVQRPDLTILSHRFITVQGTCAQLPLLSGGYGINSTVTYQDPLTNAPTTFDFVRVGPGAATYSSSLNSLCGARCATVLVLHSADNATIPEPKLFTCNNTLSRVHVPRSYINILDDSNVTADIYNMPDQQAFILAGAIGWTGFNHTTGDEYQYVRYTTESWWSPDHPASAETFSQRIMQFSIEAVAAMDYNGPRVVVPGYYPVPAQTVNVDWWWAGTVLAVIPLVQLVLMFMVIGWANHEIIRDESYLSAAKLLGEVVGRVEGGSLLTGEEIAEGLGAVKVRYGEVTGEDEDGDGDEEDRRRGEVARGLRFENDISDGKVRKVGLVEAAGQRTKRRKGRMRPGLYD